MEAIWKKIISLEERQTVELPVGAKVLCVKMQHNTPCIWFITPQTNFPDVEKRTFVIYITGSTHKEIVGKYINTILMHDNRVVFHVFEE